MKQSKRYSPEVRQRAIRMVFEHKVEHASRWAAIGSIAGKTGYTPETLHSWVRQAERDRGLRDGQTTEGRERLRREDVDVPDRRLVKYALSGYYTKRRKLLHGHFRQGVLLLESITSKDLSQWQ